MYRPTYGHLCFCFYYAVLTTPVTQAGSPNPELTVRALIPAKIESTLILLTGGTVTLHPVIVPLEMNLFIMPQ